MNLINSISNEQDYVNGFDKDLDKNLELIIYNRESTSDIIRFVK